MMPPQGQMPQDPAMMQQQPDPVNEASQLLGIDVMQEQLKTMMQDKVKAEVGSKFPDVPYEIVEKSIEKIEKVDPQTAQYMRTQPDGMEMAYKAALADIKPQEKPDNLTEGESGGGQSEELNDKVMKGNASDFDLGDFVLDYDN